MALLHNRLVIHTGPRLPLRTAPIPLLHASTPYLAPNRRRRLKHPAPAQQRFVLHAEVVAKQVVGHTSEMDAHARAAANHGNL